MKPAFELLLLAAVSSFFRTLACALNAVRPTRSRRINVHPLNLLGAVLAETLQSLRLPLRENPNDW